MTGHSPHRPTHRLVPRGRKPAPQPDLFTTAVPTVDFPPEEDLSLDACFARFHTNHPEVYRGLVALAREAKQAGQTRVGIGMLFEVLRWQRVVAGDDHETFLLNNNYRSRYARLIMANERDLDDIFATRDLPSKRVYTRR